MNVKQVAQVCHEANRAYCETLGDFTQKPWAEAEDWQRQSAISGVRYAIAFPGAPASAQHDAWLSDKKKDGWRYGPVKDPAKKEHPCFVPFEELPMEQRIKDHLFKSVVNAFRAC